MPLDGILTVPQDLIRQIQIPEDIPSLCRFVQKLLVHDAALANALYGPVPASLIIERDTKPVSARLRAALAPDSQAVRSPISPYDRQSGTCRDFAAMLCALARLAGFEAQVRCGFAAYFRPGVWEDHWIVQYRKTSNQRWSLADAQLDSAHIEHYGIGFDPSDMPADQFLTADKTWRAWRRGSLPVEALRHGGFAGQRMACVNLVRDALSQTDILTSDWDQWRDLGDLGNVLSAPLLQLCDHLSKGNSTALKDILTLGLAGIAASE